MNKKLCFGLLLLSALTVVSCQKQEETFLLSGEKTEQQERTEDTAGSEEKEDSKKEDSEKEPDISVEKADVQQICVFLCGAVNRPGVYYLKEGARLYEGIAAAGGFSQDADENWWNQAAVMADGSRIQIYTRKETEAFRESGQGPGSDAGAAASIAGSGSIRREPGPGKYQYSRPGGTADSSRYRRGKSKSDPRLSGGTRGVFICGRDSAGARHQR